MSIGNVNNGDGGNVNYLKTNKPQGEHMEKTKDLNELFKKAVNLFGTEAGSIARALDSADGTKDGKIEASVWNKYAKEHGGKEVSNYIDVNDAVNSITSYSVREQDEEVKAQKENLGINGNPPEPSV